MFPTFSVTPSYLANSEASGTWGMMFCSNSSLNRGADGISNDRYKNGESSSVSGKISNTYMESVSTYTNLQYEKVDDIHKHPPYTTTPTTLNILPEAGSHHNLSI